jgi:3-hydroxy-9,10-secoandrosta-1,3,5(10)-triene-9,17-dione monooxygenase reductase component
MMFSQRDFRDAASLFPTGISVVTTRSASDNFIGVTVNSFSSISLEPPLIAFSLGKSLTSLPDFIVARYFAINILGHDQHEISARFAKSGTDKWAALQPDFGPAGSPFIRPNVAAFECESHAHYEGGDHLIFLGRVLHLEAGEKSDPLVFFRSNYRRLCWHDSATTSDAAGSDRRQTAHSSASP